MSPWRARIASLLALLALGVAFALAAPRFRFTTEITEFLPDDDEHRGAQLAAMFADSQLTRVLVLDVSLVAAPAQVDAGALAEGVSSPALRDLARALLTFLRSSPEIARARSGLSEAETAELLAFLETLPVTALLPPERYTEDALRERLGDLLDELSSSAGMLVRRTAPRDPLGGVRQLVDALRDLQGAALVDDDGVLVTRDGAHALLFVETRASPFDSDAQRRFRAALDAWWARAAPPGARLETAGAAPYALASEAQMKADIGRIGALSTAGIVALFVLLFGSARLLVLGFVPMAFGSAIAVLACQAWFGEVHGITIAFGTSLLGVGLDYVEHYYAHFVLTPEVPAAATMRRVAPSLALGALTTIIGFIGIGASGVPGLRQMAMFSAIAVIASMSATYFLVPAWMPRRYRPPRTLGLVSGGVLAVMRRLAAARWSPRWRIAALALAALAAVAALRAARFTDDVNLLVEARGRHVAEDRAVRGRLGPEQDAYAVVRAASEDALAAAIERTCEELRAARAGGLVASFVELDRLVPSRARQVAWHRAAREAAPRLRALMEELGFLPEQFQPFWAALEAEAPPSLTLAALRRSPLGPLIAGWIPPRAEPVALIPLTGVASLAALRARAPSATVVAPAATVRELFRGVRVRTITASAVGLVVILLLLIARYRGAARALIALTPATLACAATVGALVLAGVALNILHVMALLLVLAMGVDFGIFFVDTTETLEESSRTMVSILTASVTTILSFGLLGGSASPGLAALGLTVTLGVSFSLLFCFVMIAALAPVTRRRGGAAP